MQETNETNNIIGGTDSIEIVLPPYPDLLVKDIQSLTGSIVPDSTFSLGWIVENIGDASAIGGWSQKISMMSATKSYVLGYVQTGDTLPASGITSQSVSLNVPKIPAFDGDVFLKVELIPSAQLIEKPNGNLNNLALSVDSILVERRLFFSFPQETFDESDNTPVQCKVMRSGNQSGSLEVSLNVSEPGRLNIPTVVTIPAGHSAGTFMVSAINNEELEGDMEVLVSADASSYVQSTSNLTVLDDETAFLYVNIGSATASEGDNLQVTVTRDSLTTLPLNVSLYTTSVSQVILPDSVVIEQGENEATFNLQIIDNDIPELDKEIWIQALGAGFISGSDSLIILDDDIPQISLTINPDSVSEGGGPYASWATVQLSEASGTAVDIQISAEPTDQVYFPAQVTIPAGVLEQQFNIGTVDNGVLDGNRNIGITAAVYISSCGCGAPSATGGAVTDSLTILDNDGPSLTVTSDPFLVYENKANAGILTISRNTLGGSEIVVNLQHNGPDEIVLPPTATILEDEDFVEVPFNTLDDGIEDGDQLVTITITADGYNTGTCWVMVSDRNLPDFVLSDFTLSENEVLINEEVQLSLTIKNEGFAEAAAGAEIKVYKSDNEVLDDDDLLLSLVNITEILLVGDSVEYFLKSINLRRNWKLLYHCNG